MAASPAFEPTYILRWGAGIRGVRHCVSTSGGIVVSGLADVKAVLGDQPLPAPRTARFRQLPAHAVSYIARVTY